MLNNLQMELLKRSDVYRQLFKYNFHRSVNKEVVINKMISEMLSFCLEFDAKLQ